MSSNRKIIVVIDQDRIKRGYTCFKLLHKWKSRSMDSNFDKVDTHRADKIRFLDWTFACSSNRENPV